MELFYISGNRNPKKLLIFQEVTSRAQKMKKPTLEKLIFQEMELLIFQVKLLKPQKLTFLIFLQKRF